MKQLSGPRTSANLSESTQKQLNAYAVAVGTFNAGSTQIICICAISPPPRRYSFFRAMACVHSGWRNVRHRDLLPFVAPVPAAAVYETHTAVMSL